MSVSLATHALAEMEKTFGTAGKEERVLKAGVEAELFRYSGKGFLTHMWFGGDFKKRGIENVPLGIGGVRLPENARLRLYKVVNRETKPLEEFAMYDTPRSGMLYMVTIAGKSSAFCFMESCVRAYMEGAKAPLLLSSGLEDYFLGTYDFNKGRYYTPVAGVTHLVPGAEFSAYRFHEADPVFFANGLRLTLRDGEESHGQVFGCSPKDTVFTTYIWVYEW
jgi:hypothetical protein